MMVTSILREGDKLSDDQIKMIENAERQDIVFDDDCPETTVTELERFRKVARARNMRAAQS